MTNALRSAERNPDEVDVIYAHATATPLGDIAETLAIKRVLKDHAYEIPISATKSQIGHTFGAAGALAAIAAIYAIGEGVVCPTINYTTPDPECDLDCVPNEAREVEVKTAVVNAFGFGGQNVALVLGAYD
jgi:3-oxoacyl-(acyl-carrier-protein) synthase